MVVERILYYYFSFNWPTPRKPSQYPSAPELLESETEIASYLLMMILKDDFTFSLPPSRVLISKTLREKRHRDSLMFRSESVHNSNERWSSGLCRHSCQNPGLSRSRNIGFEFGRQLISRWLGKPAKWARRRRGSFERNCTRNGYVFVREMTIRSSWPIDPRRIPEQQAR